MLNFKKAASVSLVICSTSLFAGQMGPICTPDSVTVPCKQTAWDFGIQALYLKTVFDTDFAYLNAPYVVNGTTRFHERTLDWGWGVRLEGSYHFYTGNDVTVNWLHYRKETDGTKPIGTAAPYRMLKALTTPQIDAVNVEMGQHVDYGQKKDIRYHAGIQWAKIQRKVNVGSNGATTTTQDSTFNGLGARIGADMSYDFNNGLSIYGNGAGTILVGKSEFNAQRFGGNSAGRYVGDKSAFVPALEAKLGAKYSYAMANGNVTLDAGWFFEHYFNALHNYRITGDRMAESDFSFNGPYIGFKYVSMV